MATLVDDRKQMPPTGQTAGAAPPLTAGLIGEDWMAVCLGLFLIAIVLAGAQPQLPVMAWTDWGELSGVVFGFDNLRRILAASTAALVLSAVAARAMGASAGRFAAGFLVLIGLCWLAQGLAGQATVRYWGIEYVIFALVIGLIISNGIGVPGWLVEAARTEFYIKTGLVLLGATIVFGDIWHAGLLGIGQGVLVVTIVWFFSFWLSKRLRVDDELAVMLATAVSICGVSAAIAACGAIQGDRKKLSYVTSLVLIVAVPMMIVMPRLIIALEIPDAVGGAWLGGTLDTSASVVAAGEIVGAAARNTGVVVKLSQNVLIGLAAFLLTMWWAMRARETTRDVGRNARVIWQRFPKFVLGFLFVSLLFSFWIDPGRVVATRAALNGLRTIWFALAFTSIGLEARFADLLKLGDGRPALSFLGAQLFNVLVTLALAYLFFGGLLFPAPSLPSQ